MSHRPNLIQRIGRAFSANKKAPTKANELTRSIHDPPNAIPTLQAKYQIGQVVRHRLFDFRGVIFDVDPTFANTEEWYQAIPEEVRPAKNQPYYHLFAENERTHYVAYVSEQNLMPEDNATPVTHPDIPRMFERTASGYVLKSHQRN